MNWQKILFQITPLPSNLTFQKALWYQAGCFWVFWLKKSKKMTSKFYLDGFPRNMENLKVWKGMDLDEEFDVKMALFLDCCFETMESNVLERSKDKRSV